MHAFCFRESAVSGNFEIYFLFFLANNPYKAKAGPVFLNKTTRSAITPALNRDTMLQVVTKEL